MFVGEAGAIKGQVNPDLRVPEGKVVQINLVNGDGALHDIAIPEFQAQSDQISDKGASTTIVFRTTRSGTFEYICSLPGHKAAGMVGKLIVGDVKAVANTAAEIAMATRRLRSRLRVPAIGVRGQASTGGTVQPPGCARSPCTSTRPSVRVRRPSTNQRTAWG